MLDKKRDIRNFIWEQIDEDGRIIETEDFEDIYDLISFVNSKFDCSIEVIKVGGFNSPGYDIYCYAWAGIIDGVLYFDSLQAEYY